METINLVITAKRYPLSELAEDDRELMEAAAEASHRAYAPYSNFFVGAAARMADGRIFTGNNQENVAYPSGLCAERVTLFAAQAAAPDTPVSALALVCRTPDGPVAMPSPCAGCRQVILGAEERHGRPMRILLCGKDYVTELPSALSLVPFWSDPVITQ